MRLEEAVRDTDPVMVTTSLNVRGGRGKIDGLPETKASSLPPWGEPFGRLTEWHKIVESRDFLLMVKRMYFEANIVNHSWGYIQVPQELERCHFHKPQNLVIWKGLGNEKFTCQGEGFPNL